MWRHTVDAAIYRGCGDIPWMRRHTVDAATDAPPRHHGNRCQTAAAIAIGCRSGAPARLIPLASLRAKDSHQLSIVAHWHDSARDPSRLSSGTATIDAMRSDALRSLPEG